MRNQLSSLYTSRIEDFSSVKNAHPDAKLNGPFLTSPNEAYSRQTLPALFVGQQTLSWGENTGEQVDVEKLMIECEEFGLGKGYYSSPFWNVMRKIERALGNEDYSSAWTNLNKFAQNGKKPKGRVADSISTLDDVLRDELRILQPKVCVFFTSWHYDDRLQKLFDGVKFEPVNSTDSYKLARLDHPSLPKHTYRTYHPNYLRFSRREAGFIELMEQVGPMGSETAKK